MNIAEITGIINETKNIKTIRFNLSLNSKPGQFVMVWLPGIDEIPMSLSYADGITVDNVGEATQAIHGLEKGSQIGIKGPYGNGFDLSANDYLLIGGGTGIAALALAAESLGQAGKNVRMAIGARTADDLLFVERMKALGEVHIATDDGSSGNHGFVTQVAETLIADKKPQPYIPSMTLWSKVSDTFIIWRIPGSMISPPLTLCNVSPL